MSPDKSPRQGGGWENGREGGDSKPHMRQDILFPARLNDLGKVTCLLVSIFSPLPGPLHMNTKETRL